ncbi:hypothetical protein AHF37_04896 [Paragonimus kellicotti]|nr:hypothetical protein AHF37_04896 [Paragonimus kellicotti]
MSATKKDTVQLTIFEADIVKLILEFLEKRDLAISMLSLERETGQVNGPFNEDILFFRQLVLEGHVVDCLRQLEPECPSQTEYRDLALLLTLPRLDQHPAYRDWNPSLGRLQCFTKICFTVPFPRPAGAICGLFFFCI